ncbi:MAG: hypothetical protein ACTSU2_05710 [Promethearchaeota archaeon]
MSETESERKENKWKSESEELEGLSNNYIYNFLGRFKRFKDEIITFIFAFMVLCIFLIMTPVPQGIDEYFHYIISKNVQIYWASVLSPYGKPVFTLFSYIIITLTNDKFGLLSIRLFNIIVSALSVSSLYYMAELKKIKKRYIILGVATLLTYPEFIKMSISAFSEPLFTLCTIWVIIFYIKRNYTLVSLLLSLDFVLRPEAAVFILIFGLVFLKRFDIKRIIYIGIFPTIWVLLLLISGRNPMIIIEYNSFIDYALELHFKYVPFLGEGIISLPYYIIKSPQILGIFGEIIFIIGIISKIKKKEDLIIFYNILGLFIFETFIFMFPGFGSSGLTRYFYVILPLCAYYNMEGYYLLDNYIKKQLKIRKIKGNKKLKNKYYSRSIERRLNYSLEKSLHKFSSKYLYAFIIILLLISSMLMYIMPFIHDHQYYGKDYEIQDEAGQYLDQHYDLRNIHVYCPIFGSSAILRYVYSPYMYLDLEIRNRPQDGSVILYNYTVILMNGYFIENTFEQNLTTISKGSLVVWYNNSYYNNSIFNPANMYEGLNFKIIYSYKENNYTLLNVYEKI